MHTITVHGLLAPSLCVPQRFSLSDLHVGGLGSSLVLPSCTSLIDPPDNLTFTSLVLTFPTCLNAVSNTTMALIEDDELLRSRQPVPRPFKSERHPTTSRLSDRGDSSTDKPADGVSSVPERGWWLDTCST